MVHEILQLSMQLYWAAGVAVRCSAGSGTKVVVTREHGKNGKLMKALSKHGIQCLEMPLIEHAPGPDRWGRHPGSAWAVMPPAARAATPHAPACHGPA